MWNCARFGGAELTSLSTPLSEQSPQGSGREVNRLIPTVFRSGLSVLSIVIAGGLLATLLLMSGSPNQSAQRGIDIEMRYLKDLDALLETTVDASWNGKAETKSTLYELADRYEFIIKRLGEDVAQVHAPTTALASVRQGLRNWFSEFSRGSAPTQDQALAQYALLKTQSEQLAASLRDFGANQSHLLDSLAALKATSREMVGAMRSRGNNQFADLLFGAEQSVMERLRGRNREDLSTVATLVSGVRSPSYRLTESDLKSLNTFANAAEHAGEWRLGMIDHFDGMAIQEFVATRAALQENLASAYVQGLFTVNDARVLLNVYTGMLLLVLGYFGFRLTRSHRELNQSHDELETRVQERTKDLEMAMSDLTESQVQLVQAEKMSSLGQLVAGVMHEINTPLLYVLNNTSMTAEAITEMETYLDATLPLVRAESDLDRQRALKHLAEKRDLFDADIISENAQEINELSSDSVEGLNQISELVQSLKDFSRLDRAAEDRFNVVDGLEKTLVITRNLWKYGIEVEREFQDVPDIFCAPSRLNQVFINLVTNAVQAMDGKGTLTIGTSARGDWVEVTIQDTGCGIPEENLTKIMDPFFTTKPVGKGTGLGLSIVHQIIEEHEGQLLVDSKIGIGTRFTLGFPVRRSGSGKNNDDKNVSIVGSGSDETTIRVETELAESKPDADTASSTSNSSHTEAAA